MKTAKGSPDIEELTDVSRYCIHSFFPYEMNTDGSVRTIYYVEGVTDRVVYGRVYYNGSKIRSAPLQLSFESFLAIDAGPFRSHMMEYKDSLVYVYNNSPGSRTHGLNANNWAVKCFYPAFEGMLHQYNEMYEVAMQLFDYKRTKFNVGIRRLQDGDAVGIALSDRFGIITTEDHELPQIVYKQAIIGHILDERPVLKPAYRHLSSTIAALCLK